jgi:tRNA(His) 5'-end guanylyltransferase
MRTEALKSRMRELEWFHSLRALPATWIVLRVDGRSFSRLTEARFDKPFDPRFHELMVQVSTALLTELQGLFVLTQSDEASLLLPIAADLFDREVEKLVSLSASVATAAFSIGHGRAAHFDSRLWMGAKSELVVDYFRWRQADAARSCLNGWCYWTLRKEGLSKEAATRALHGKPSAAKHELLFRRGINFNDLPAWQRCGTGVYFRSVTEQATNRKTGEPVSAVRRRVHVDEAMPHGKGLDTLLDGLLAS